MNNKKIFITGGHLTPALAVIDELHKNNWQVYYAGRKKAMEGDAALSSEWSVINKQKIKFLNTITGRWQRHLTRYTFWSLIKVPVGFIQAIYYLIKYQPDIILSFGGYVAVPFALAGKIFRIPVITHEQTFAPGLANKIIAKFADKICVSWEETKKYFPKDKTVVTGLPIRKSIFVINKKIEILSSKPIIFVTGGNLGAHAINVVIQRNLIKLLEKYILIHQCGKSSAYHDYEKLIKARENLTSEYKNNYFIFSYIEDDLIGFVLNKAEVIIGRSGANITAEILALKKPAILIPLPWSGEGEQQYNAEFLRKSQAAVVIQQNELSDTLLLKTIEQVEKNKFQIVSQLQKLQDKLIPDAASQIVAIIESCK
jgi:UDP-N-acetylglucosamine--N-acetylmuramyl-(pentapeptide) pyrophosphoryl-undecaprenol N-acetylglucosamine transferase